MKKTIFAIAVINILMITSCKKPGDSTGAGGSWTIGSVNYPAVVVTGNPNGNAGTMAAQNQTVPSISSSYDNMIVYFPSALPTTSGAYTVVASAHGSSGNVISFAADVNGVSGTSYTSTGGNGNETVQVTVSGGKVSISGTGITMSIPATPSDSTTMSFNLTQTQ